MRHRLAFAATAATLLSLILTGCGAGEEPYHEVKKDPKQVTTAAIDSAAKDKVYFYVRSIGETPRYTLPLSGKSPEQDIKAVKLRRTPNGIQVVEVDRDNVGLGHTSRYETKANQAPLLTIPGQYIDFKCTENNWDECTNREQVNNDANLTWQDKRYFVPQFEKATLDETSYNDLFSLGSCVSEPNPAQLAYSDKKDDWKGYQMDLKSGVINFELIHTFKVNSSYNCLMKYAGNGGVKDLSFTTHEFFSIVAMDDLVSPDYKAIPYSSQASTTFGYFTVDHSYRDKDGFDGQDGAKISYLKRWNPNKESIVYYLSDEFYKPENKPFLDAAKEAIDLVNAQNVWYKTEVPKIVLKPAEGKHFGDLRYSFINLFDQPLDNGLLGYGPSNSDPFTGEIINASVNQYSANFMYQARSDYGRIVSDYNHGALDAKSVTKLTGQPYPYNGASTTKQDLAAKSMNELFAHAQSNTAPKAAAARATSNHDGFDTTSTANAFAAVTTPDSLADDANLEDIVKHTEQQKTFYAKHNMLIVDHEAGGHLRTLPYGPENNPINWKNSELWVNGVVGDQLKSRDQLPAELASKVMHQLAVDGFVGTLVHELGHTLGLRHNFSGSTDKDHLFTPQQIAEQRKIFASLGYKQANIQTDTTSQMDYNIDMFGITYGPYDLAALRFGYAREVQLADGSWKSLTSLDEQRRQAYEQGKEQTQVPFGSLYELESLNPNSDKDAHSALIDFRFCTEGNVSLNTDCNLFDAGFDKDQISQFYVDKYLNSYDTTNKRNNRQWFFEDDITSYAGKRLGEFQRLQGFAEDVAQIEGLNAFGPGTLAYECMDDPSYFFCASVDAKTRVADLMLKIIGESGAKFIAQYTDKATNQPAGTNLFTLDQLLSRYNDSEVKAKMTKHFKPGQAIARYADAPEVFDQLLLATKFDNPNDYSVKVTIGGRPLNGLKAPEADPNHPYSNERDVLGVWPDKLLAMRTLLDRHDTRPSSSVQYQAIADWKPVGSMLKAMMCRMVVGEDIDLGNGQKVLAESRCRQEANLTTDIKDKTDENYVDLKQLDKLVSPTENFIDSDHDIESLPQSATPAARYFGFDLDKGVTKGRTPLVQALLNQVMLASTDSDYKGKENADAWREFVGMHESTDNVDGQAYTVYNRKMIATDENVLFSALEQKYTQELAVYKDAAKLKSLDWTVRANLLVSIINDRKTLRMLPNLNDAKFN